MWVCLLVYISVTPKRKISAMASIPALNVNPDKLSYSAIRPGAQRGQGSWKANQFLLMRDSTPGVVIYFSASLPSIWWWVWS